LARQAALLTAVNSGKRAFHGGVNVEMPSNVPCLLPWPQKKNLNDVIANLGGEIISPVHSRFSHTIYFGQALNPVPDSLTVHCTGWRGGIAPADHEFDIKSDNDFPLGGVLAGALAVAKGFLRVSGLSSRFVEGPQGVSLWKPELDWKDKDAEGPQINLLPARLWILGLGHLGQAFLWNIGLLPYKNPGDAVFMLQDFDRVVEGNWTAGLLCERSSTGKYKTRLCADWIEQRGFQSMIMEHPFDSSIKRNGEEPFIALCGFDSPTGRRALEDAGFDLIVECGLGATTNFFDSMMIHTFPDSTQAPKEIWSEVRTENEHAKEIFLRAFKTKEDCGIITETLANKAISSSFVGAVASSFVIGELLRGLHGGRRCEIIKGDLRSNDRPTIVYRDEIYLKRFARNGFLPCKETDSSGDD
jgi:hypothetical protein